MNDALNPRPVGNLLKIFMITSVSLALLFLLLFAFIARSRAYDAAADYIVAHPTVQERVGPVKKVQMSFLSFISFRGASGAVNYKIYVYGERGTATTYLDLEHHGDAWQVRQAAMMLPDHTIVPLAGDGAPRAYY